MTRKKVIVSPFNHTENDYINLQIESIKKAGYTPVPQSGNRRDADYILYNWYENMDGRGGTLLLRKLAMLSFYRFSKKKIIWVMHNKQPHRAGDKYSLFMMRYLSKISNSIMILSDATLASLKKINSDPKLLNKVFKVPLISYETLTGNIPEKYSDDKLNLLMFGRIQPYKCIEVLIDAVNSCKYKDYISVTVVGSSRDSKYIAKLRQKIDMNDNILLIPKFISLDELKDMAAKSDAFVLPMNIDSSLNSSAVMMAFSLERTVISPEIGTIQEIEDGKDFVYSYNYSEESQHVHQLSDMLDKVYEERDTLREKGKKAFKNIQTHNSVDVVSRKFKEMFDNCI